MNNYLKTCFKTMVNDYCKNNGVDLYITTDVRRNETTFDCWYKDNPLRGCHITVAWDDVIDITECYFATINDIRTKCLRMDELCGCRIKNELNTLRDTQEYGIGKIQTLITENNNLEKENKELKHQNECHVVSIKNLMEIADNKDKRISKLKDEHDGLEKDINSLKTSLRNATENNKYLRLRINELNNSLDEKNEQIADLIEDLNKKTKENIDLKMWQKMVLNSTYGAWGEHCCVAARDNGKNLIKLLLKRCNKAESENMDLKKQLELIKMEIGPSPYMVNGSFVSPNYVRDLIKHASEMEAELRNVKDAKSTQKPEIQNIYFDDPTTAIKWSDGDITIVRCSVSDAFDAEKGVAMAICKKFMGDGYYSKMCKKMNTPNVTFKFHPYEGRRNKARCVSYGELQKDSDK